MGSQLRSAPWRATARTLAAFSLPLILSGVLQQLYNWADAFIVGNVEGELALAAIGATGTISNFCLLAITGFTVGLSIFFAQTYGRGEEALLPRILSTFTLLLGAVFLLLGLGGAAASGRLLRLLHTTADTLSLAEDYLAVIFLGIPFMAVYNVYAAALRGIGDSRAPFLAIVVSSVVNVGLDLLFVAGLGWSVTGAAAATVFSQVAMALFLVAYGSWKYPQLRFRPGKGMVDRAVLIRGLRLGVPPMIQSSVNACGGLLLQNFMNGFGTQTVAAITTAYRVDSIILLPIINLGSGISTLAAQHYGAGEEDQAWTIFGVGSLLMTAVSLGLTALVIAIGGRTIALFGVGEGAVAIGQRFFEGIAPFYLVYGLAMAARGYLEGLGDLVYTSLWGMGALAVRIAASYAGAPLWGNQIIAYAEAFSWGVLLALYLGRAAWKRRRPAA